MATMISPAEAEALVRTNVSLLPGLSVPLNQLSGRFLRTAVKATRDQPPFDRVTMDGIAFASKYAASGRRDFRIAGTQAAGAPLQSLHRVDECFEVMTGAELPGGCDCVIPVEKVSITDGRAQLIEDVVATPGMNVHTRGLDARRGALLLEPGTRLGPSEVAVIASTGLSQAQVNSEPRIMVISTGNELVEPGGPVADGQVYRSNAFGVIAALQEHGHRLVAQDHLPDDIGVLRHRLRIHLEAHEVLILSGGVSVGRYDYIPQVLRELGVSVVFHNVAQRPGKPMLFGVGPAGQSVYALPGNPVSTLICLRRYVLPGLDAAAGASPAVPEVVELAEDFTLKPALTLFLPVSPCNATSGASSGVQPRPTRGSGDFVSLIGTHGFVELPPGPRFIPRATTVCLYRW